MDNSNFIKHVESLKHAAIGVCSEITNMINKEFEKAGPEHAEKFRAAKESSEALKMAAKDLDREIGNFNKTKF